MILKSTIISSLIFHFFFSFVTFEFYANVLKYFQAKRDRYREMSMKGVHVDLIFRFIELQALLMCPICPHIAEYIWGLLGKVTTIFFHI